AKRPECQSSIASLSASLRNFSTRSARTCSIVFTSAIVLTLHFNFGRYVEALLEDFPTTRIPPSVRARRGPLGCRPERVEPRAEVARERQPSNRTAARGEPRNPGSVRSLFSAHLPPTAARGLCGRCIELCSFEPR